MLKHQFFRCRFLTVGLLATFILLVTPIDPFAQGRTLPQSASGSRVGFIYAKDATTPVQNAVVKLRNLAKAKDYESEPSDANGMYTISGLEEGRYIMGVTSPTGDYNFYYSLALKGSEMAKLSVALTPSPAAMAGQADTDKTAFFKSPMGIVTVVIVAGAILYGFTAKKEEASPIK